MADYTVTVEGKDYDVTAPDPNTAWRWAKAFHGTRMRDFETKKLAQTEADRATYDPTKGMGVGEKTLANLGAGINRAWQGFKQLAPGFKAPSDEDIRETRERDKQLAKSTETGAGADWLPSAGSALQFAGEVLPTLAIPAGAATGTAARVLPRVLTRALANPIAAGAMGGAAAGALQPVTSDESRALNVGLGAAGGAVLPGAVAAYRASRGLTNAGSRAGRKLLEAAGDEATDIAHATALRANERAGQAPLVRAIPESLAEASGSTRMARLESQLGRDAATADDMAAFVRSQNAARHTAVEGATREAAQLGGRDAVRQATTDPMRAQALQAAGRDPWFHTPVVAEVQNVMRGPGSVNPAVRRVADEVMRNIDERSGTAITPERLYELRKLLADKMTGPTQIGDELSNAVKGANRETAQLIRAIDNALDASSGGQFTPYLRQFQSASRDVDASRAAQTVRDRMNQLGAAELGGAPQVTRSKLSRAIAASEERGRKFPLRLSQSARGQLEDVLGGLTRAEEVQNATLAASARGGSRTSTDLDGLLKKVGGKVPGLGGIIDSITSRVSDATKQELVRLMQNPEQAMAALAAAQRARQPLSEAQQILLSAAGTGAGASAPALLSQ